MHSERFLSIKSLASGSYQLITGKGFLSFVAAATLQVALWIGLCFFFCTAMDVSFASIISIFLLVRCCLITTGSNVQKKFAVASTNNRLTFLNYFN